MAGVLDGPSGPFGVCVRFPRPGSIPEAAQNGHPPEGVSVAGHSAKSTAPHHGNGAAHAPLVIPFPLPSEPRQASPWAPSRATNIEPVILQGVLLIALRSRLLGVDLFAARLTPEPLIVLDNGLEFLGSIHRVGGRLIAMARGRESAPALIALQPALDEWGVVNLKGKWTWQILPAQAPDHLATGLELTRAILAGNAFFLPTREAVLVASQLEGEQGIGWVWRKELPHGRYQAFGDTRYACAIDPHSGREGVPDARHPGEAADLQRPTLSPGLLLQGIDERGDVVWVRMTRKPSGRITSNTYPVAAATIVVTDGRIFSIDASTHTTTVQELNDVGVPRINQPAVVIDGAVVDRLVPVGEDLAVLVREGEVLRLLLYTGAGNLRREGGQLRLEVGSSVAPPIVMDDRIICLWQNNNQIEVASAMLGQGI